MYSFSKYIGTSIWENNNFQNEMYRQKLKVFLRACIEIREMMPKGVWLTQIILLLSTFISFLHPANLLKTLAAASNQYYLNDISSQYLLIVSSSITTSLTSILCHKIPAIKHTPLKLTNLNLSIDHKRTQYNS